ncbi:16S rRNA (adenine(1518)-N(6)/adenine(1519)-N(6))-dimethyltransferase RsmA [Floccifex sp.]|uniref:16S rRNA (adenine(1518)-N(6)/adenine(1519)-N(6))- dimethyltransferase RsmA n=1 Tax=Floccifex sp. TaxID=2815810 RepID=UPI002A76595B|nr:16S rRNA (adenine(1518)-N(6)/adenine(1519)-N(6))-dimethyltransferase RsmA [Floccifex sp.]MDD7282197.1 16S rRNA (adenine(1518)-N(6)/adenine(1519)-N(6))-dimethyltransferase RsmA [Erysipelotrichaceae bacterium]MDY2958426.1 16S rRNA (adenine(1518)-N(6)/adenine(1519)-N(6))-dimethyltransferase RsmA [Floccifex sp.]
MNQRIATIKKTKEIQEKYNVFTKKTYGQNFIIEPKVVEKIAQAAIESPDELVFEIGPGIGALTQCLCERSNHVVAFEIDDRLPMVLENEIGFDHLEVILQDFMKVDVDQQIQKYRKENQKVVFASNLPYYITTPILFKLFEAKEKIERITVMMQKEVGERFLAKENEKEYNALSVITQYRCDVKKVMDVSRHVFWPKPNVDSMVVQFSFHHKYRLENEDVFFKMVKSCFTQRRKTIYNNFQDFVKDKELAKNLLIQANIEPSTRAQQCTLEDFIRLYEVGKGYYDC